MRKITVFTPTFNRAHTLEKLYHSLLLQSYKNFCWLIIDDGSTDNTKDIVENFIKENKILIKYIKVENGGKHRAINKALDIVKTKLFFIVDSDDYLTNNALEKIIECESTVTQNSVAGIVGLKGNLKNKIQGTTFKGKYIDLLNYDRIKNNITGDKAEVFYTDILKKYKFPEIDGEKFLTEAIVWNQMAIDGYKLRYFNEVIYICEYLNDGLTKNIEEIYKKNPRGFLLYIKQLIYINKKNLFEKIKYVSYYYKIVKNKYSKEMVAKQLEVSVTFLIIANIIRKISKH
ncbi:MAG: glycosyltransferase family 2 protein [Clostridia bacterium]